MTQFVYGMWPLMFWRLEPLNEKDFEWFEEKYPGWYEQYGAFWEAYAQTTDPADHTLLAAQMMEQAPPLCWTCQLPVVFEEDLCHRVVGDRTRFYCHHRCRRLDETRPGRYAGDRNWFDKFDGWDLSEVVRQLGFVRSDGETLVAQPHHSDDPAMMWTLSDIEHCNVKIQSPNIRLAKQLGLPSGSSVGLVPDPTYGAAAEHGIEPDGALL